ncbi:MAG TPA: hypothetical protein PK156_45835, partial [Polyangium sp.]|nr:hypothetical protein [Polyangium sp.]
NSVCQAVAPATGDGFIYAVTTNGIAVYFASFVENSMTGPQTTIYKIGMGGGQESRQQLSTVFNGRVKYMAATCDKVYFAIAKSVDGAGMTTAQPHIAYVPENGVNVPPTDLAAADNVVAMAAERDLVTWVSNSTTAGEGGVKAYAGAGANVETVYPLGSLPLTDVAIRDGYVYWSEAGLTAGGGNIFRAIIPTQGTNWQKTLVRANPGTPVSLAVDGKSVYWIDFHAGVLSDIRKAPKDMPMQADSRLASFAALSLSDAPSSWLGVDDTTAYFVEDLGTGTGMGAVVAYGTNGGTKVAVISNANSTISPNITALTLDSRRVYAAATSTSMSSVIWVAK